MDIARGRRFALPAFTAAVVAATLIGSTGAASAALPHRPSPPVDLGMEGWGPNGSNALPCRAGDSRPAVGTRTPRLRAKLSDPDDGLLSANFTVRQGETAIATLTATDVPSGSFAEVKVP